MSKALIAFFVATSVFVLCVCGLYFFKNRKDYQVIVPSGHYSPITRECPIVVVQINEKIFKFTKPEVMTVDDGWSIPATVTATCLTKSYQETGRINAITNSNKVFITSSSLDGDDNFEPSGHSPRILNSLK